MRKEAACSEIEEGMEKVPAAMREYVAATDSVSKAGVSILISYGEKPHYVKLPIFIEFMENSEIWLTAKSMKNSGLTKWTQNLR